MNQRQVELLQSRSSGVKVVGHLTEEIKRNFNDIANMNTDPDLAFLTNVLNYAFYLYSNNVFSLNKALSEAVLVVDEPQYVVSGGGVRSAYHWMKRRVQRKKNASLFEIHFLLTVTKFATAAGLKHTLDFIKSRLPGTSYDINSRKNSQKKSLVEALDNRVLEILRYRYSNNKGPVTHSTVKYLQKQLTYGIEHLVEFGQYRKHVNGISDNMYATMSATVEHLSSLNMVNVTDKNVKRFLLLQKVLLFSKKVNWVDTEAERIHLYNGNFAYDKLQLLKSMGSKHVDRFLSTHSKYNQDISTDNDDTIETAVMVGATVVSVLQLILSMTLQILACIFLAKHI